MNKTNCFQIFFVIFGVFFTIGHLKAVLMLEAIFLYLLFWPKKILFVRISGAVWYNKKLCTLRGLDKCELLILHQICLLSKKLQNIYSDFSNNKAVIVPSHQKTCSVWWYHRTFPFPWKRTNTINIHEKGKLKYYEDFEDFLIFLFLQKIF